MTDDDRFDDWLRHAADSYHRPPTVVPRETMWDAIRARQGGPASRVEASIQTRARPWVRWGAYAAAAVLLLAAGIGIGSRLRSPDTIAGTTPNVAPARGTAGDNAESQLVSPSYDLAAAQHFTSAEALLTSFRRVPSDSAGAALRPWARDLLADTRLLLDSPAAANPSRRQLLQDLELTLVQIVQSATESSDDRAWVHRSLDRDGMLGRLRSSIPAGLTSGT